MVAAGSLSINGIDIASYIINFVLSTGSLNCIYDLSKLVCDGLQNYLDFKDTLYLPKPVLKLYYKCKYFQKSS